MSIVTSVTTTTPIDNTERLRRQQAVDGAIAQLSYNTYIGSDGKAVNMLSQYELTDLMGARGPVADSIRSLLSVQPPLSSSEVQSRASALVNQFRSQFPVAARAPVVTTTTTAPVSTMSTRDRLLRQQAVDGSVALLAYNVFPDPSGKQIFPLRNGYTLAQMNEKRAPFTAQIKALLAKEPPLTPDQIRTESAKIINNFRALFGGGTTATAATTASADEAKAARQAAADAAIAKLRAANSATYDGDEFTFSEWMGPNDLAEERKEFEDKITAMVNDPTATPASITAAAEGVINDWKTVNAAVCSAFQQSIVLMAINNMFAMQNILNQMSF